MSTEETLKLALSLESGFMTSEERNSWVKQLREEADVSALDQALRWLENEGLLMLSTASISTLRNWFTFISEDAYERGVNGSVQGKVMDG